MNKVIAHAKDMAAQCRTNPISFLKRGALIEMFSRFYKRPVENVRTFTDDNFLHAVRVVDFADGETVQVGSKKSVEFVSWVKKNWGKSDGTDWYWKLQGEEIPILRLNREIWERSGGLEKKF
jgi:hypothetical protein